MLRFITRALAAWASIAVVTLLAPTTSADTFHLLIEDNFSDPASVSDRWQIMAGNWSAARGTYGSTVPATSITTIRQYPVIEPGQPPLPRLLYDVFTLRARMRNPGTSAAQWVGLVYNFQDPLNYHEVVFSPTGIAAVRRVQGGMTTTSTVGSYTGGGTGVWFDVAVLRNENHSSVTIEVNGVPLFVDLFHDGFTDGLAGLVTYGVAGRFDKVSLSLPGDRPYRETFDAEIAAGPWFPPWVVKNGTYGSEAVRTTNLSLLGAAIGPMAATQSYTFRARMFNPYVASGNLVGVVFHREAERDYAEVVFSPTGIAQINRVVGFTKQTLATATYAGRPRTWFDVKFELASLNRISVSVDGQQLFDNVSAGDLISGRFGLITHWTPGLFDDVWVDPEIFAPLSETFANPPPPSWVRSGQWDTTGGTLNSTAIGIADVVATQCACWKTDFRYRARLLNEFGASGNLVGLVYNYQTNGLYAGDYYEVVFSPTGIARVNKVIQGTRYVVANASHGVPRNVWFDVEVVRSGLSTTVLVNGNTAFDDVTQGELGAGDVGVVTHWSRGRFDDLNVEEFVIR